MYKTRNKILNLLAVYSIFNYLNKNNHNNHKYNLMSVYREGKENGNVIKEYQRDPNDKDKNIESIIDKDLVNTSYITESWYNEYVASGKFNELKQYLAKKSYSLKKPKKFGAIKGIKGAAYSTTKAESLDDKLEVIGLPADYGKSLNEMMENTGLNKEQAKEYIITHENIHTVLHSSGYNSKGDLLYKEGQVESLMYEYFKEKAINAKDKSEFKHYSKMASVAKQRAENYKTEYKKSA